MTGRLGRFDPLLLGLLMLVVLAPALSVSMAAWVEQLGALGPIGMGGVLLGFLLARSRAPGALAHLLSLVAGAEVLALLFARLGPSGWAPREVAWLAARIVRWAQAVTAGGASGDPLLFAVAMGALAWCIGYASAWLLFRGHSPWLVVSSNGVALLLNLSYAPPNQGGLLGFFLFASLLLVATHQVAQHSELWRFARLRVQPGLGARLLGGGALLSGLLLPAAWTLPSVAPNPAVASGWEQATAPWRGLESTFGRAFASLNGPPGDSATRGLNFGRTLAPRGSFDLGDTPVFRVQSDRPLYWRATTADRYTGDAITSSEATTLSFDANTSLLPTEGMPATRAETTATVTILASRSLVAFAPEAPLRLSVPTQVDQRGSLADIASVRLQTPLLRDQQYTVVSATSTATPSELRAAGQQYPEWVQQRYLPLPRTLPERVRQRAREVAGAGATPFDAAVAIESYLRSSFEYSTHVPVVPPGRDWADYFLFDSRTGYCDYFSTTMVVMLRSLGVPARVAAGFAPGTRDAATGTWLVRENNAHSWVEAYFPGYGWILFEPSAIQPTPERVDAPAPVAAPAATSTADPAATPPPLTPEQQQPLNDPAASPSVLQGMQLPPWAVASLAGLALLAALVASAWLALTLAWRRGMSGVAAYQRPYVQLLRLARWARVLRPRAGETPYEVARHLARDLPSARATVDDLARAYVEGTYGGRVPSGDALGRWRTERRSIAVTLGQTGLQRLMRRAGWR